MTQNGNWNDGSTWVGGVAPDSHKIDVTLKHEVQVTSAEKVNNLTIFKDNDYAGKLKINSGRSISIANNLTINNTAVNSILVKAGNLGPGLIKIGGTYSQTDGTGVRVYFNHKMTDASFNQKWMLIGSPLEDATIANFINNSTSLVTSGGRTAFAPYDDNLSAGSKYTYVADPYTGTDSFIEGKGYTTQLNAGEGTPPTLQFRGKIQDTSY